MRVRLFEITRWLALSFLVAGPVSLAFGQDKPTATTQPAGAGTAAKADQAGPQKPAKSDGLKDLEENLFRPLQKTFEPDLSPDSMMGRPAKVPTPAQGKRMKEAMERKKNWVFMTPEELIVGQSGDGNHEGQGGPEEDKSVLTPMEQRYYQSLYQPNKTKQKQRAKGVDDPFYDPLNKDPLLKGVDEKTGAMEADQAANDKTTSKKASDKAAGKENESKPKSASIFSDIFGIGQRDPTKEEERAEKARLDAYRQSLGLPVTPSFDGRPASAFPGLADAAPGRAVTTPAMDTSTSLSKPAGYGSQFGTIPTLPSLPSLTPAGPQPGGLPNLTPSLPKIEPARTLPPAPTFAAPRRAF